MKRDWKKYNRELVKRGELLFDLGFLDGWKRELRQMNRGKEGARFRYPESFVEFLGVFRCFTGLPFRQEEGFVEALRKFLPKLKKPDHSTIHRRVCKFEPKLKRTLEKLTDIVVAIDASGVKVTNRGEWIREQWNRKPKRGYLKIHVAVDTKTKQILAIEVTDERTGDNKKFKPLVERASERASIKVALADSAYDSRDNFDFLETMGIEPGIKIKRGASGKARGSWARRRAAREFLKGEDKWKRRVGYGKRWIVESVFSSFKRTFGEFVRAKRFEHMIREIMLKAFAYNFMLQVAKV